jgi:hypothetical protein
VTKPTGVGRGKGGGRPRKKVSVPAETKQRAKAEAKRLEKAAVTDETALAPAANLVTEAYATLADVMDNCPIGGPRVAAAKAIIELARAGEAAAEKARAEASGMTGKKAQAQAAAEARITSGGKYSAPPPPGAVRGPERMQ